ncbi:MAG: sugar ABC transporter ATP-binding protein [Anaerolineae bacterium]|nr:sugar ABC transporter ATP-binding protein [Anaerolineae bacterium]
MQPLNATAAATLAARTNLLEMRGIHKHFPGVHALKGVDFDLMPGEVHALVGENGAGKSTLMLILAGVYQPDAGTLTFDQQPNLVIHNERHAQSLGIAIVYQERSLFAQMSVAENIFAGRQPLNRVGNINYGMLYGESRRLLAGLDLDIDPRKPLIELSFAQQQMVEVAKALSLNARMLILDEPTGSLTNIETESLFRVIRRLQTQGVGIIYISHRLEEIFQIADRVSVLKDGEMQGTKPTAQTNPQELVRLMVGREMLYDAKPRAVPADAPAALRVVGLSDSAKLPAGQIRLQDIDLTVRAGEILAVAGLEGSGRNELALAIFGARPFERGEIWVDGVRRHITLPQQAIAAGIGYLPPDRKEASLFLEMSISNNIGSARLGSFGEWWWSERKRDTTAEMFRQKLHIAAPSVARLVQTLSGGNQQKVVISKWLLVNPRVLIVNEPTRGIDVSVKAEVHKLLRELADAGTAVMVISSELPEVLAVGDRIAVMRAGRITGELPRAEATEEKIMTLASFDIQN